MMMMMMMMHYSAFVAFPTGGWGSSPHLHRTQASDFGPRTALRIVDGVREEVKGARVKTAEDMRGAVKASLLSLLTTRGGDTELQVGCTFIQCITHGSCQGSCLVVP